MPDHAYATKQFKPVPETSQREMTSGAFRECREFHSIFRLNDGLVCPDMACLCDTENEVPYSAEQGIVPKFEPAFSEPIRR